MTDEGEFNQPETKPQRTFAVSLVSLGNVKEVKASLQIGEIIGHGESGVVRDAQLLMPDKNGEHPRSVALKIFHLQDNSRESHTAFPPDQVSSFNAAYEAQLIYYECLRRAGAHVIPTFELAVDAAGNTIGIVMTNLATEALTPGSGVIRVDSTKTDVSGKNLSLLSRSHDVQVASQLGLSLDHDSWMLQYSSRWSGVGKYFPQAVLSDIIGLQVKDRAKLKKFLDGHTDLGTLAWANPVLISVLA